MKLEENKLENDEGRCLLGTWKEKKNVASGWCSRMLTLAYHATFQSVGHPFAHACALFHFSPEHFPFFFFSKFVISG